LRRPKTRTQDHFATDEFYKDRVRDVARIEATLRIELSINNAMTDSAETPSAFVGIDWADSKHDIHVYPADGSAPSHEVIEAKGEAIQDWILKMRERFAREGAKIFVSLEQSKGALIYQLMEYDFFVLYPINPKTLAKFREAFRPSGAKGDASDADLLCELVRLHPHRLKAWKPDDAQTRKLAAFCEKRRQTVQRAVRLVQQLRAELKSYYPFVLEELDLQTVLACDFLQRWPTLEGLRRAKPQIIRKFFYAHNYRRGDKLEALLKKLATAATVTSDSAIIEPAATHVRLLAAQLRAILVALPQFDEKIAELFQTHPDAQIFESFPGAGPQLAPRLLTAFGTDRTRVESAEQMSVLSGIAPIRIASGKTCLTAKRWACPKFLRQSFHEFARCSLSRCAWAKAFYEEQRARNKHHHTAIRALAFKWIRILFACWKNRQPYDDALYSRCLQKRGSAFACA
jgi:transposase